MRTIQAIYVAVVSIGSISACAPPPESVDGLMLQMRSEAWEDALNAARTDELLGMYTETSRVLPPNAELDSGRAAVEAQFGAMMAAGIGGELTSIEARECGDIGYNVGLYTLGGPDGSVDRGKFIEIWRRDSDGQWRISNDIWNSDLPVAKVAPDPTPAAETTLTFIHEVEDPERWLAAWSDEYGRRAQFRDHGARHVHVFRDSDNPNLTGLVVSVSDLEKFEAFITSDAGRAAAVEDGVRPDTLQVFREID